MKWRDLDYCHATWELDNANFLSSSLGQDLVRNYEIRRGKANSEANKVLELSLNIFLEDILFLFSCILIGFLVFLLSYRVLISYSKYFRSCL